MYHYVATLDFPYSIGCLRGSWSQSAVQTLSGPRPSGGGRQAGGPPQGPGHRPPPRRH